MKIFSSIIIAIVALVCFALPALAQLGISPGSMEITVSEGENTLPSITVRNDSEKPMDFDVKLAGYGQDIGGNTAVLEPDTNPLSAVGYIRFDITEFRLEPGESQSIFPTVSIPMGTGGGRYAVVLVIGRPASEEAISTVSRLGVLVRLTVEGTQLIQQGSINDVRSGAIEPDKPIPIKTAYTNEGNVHYKVRSSVTISNSRGEVLNELESKAVMVLPGYTREINAEWIPDSVLEPGKYSTQARVFLEDGTLIDEAEGSFEVGTSYIPPSLPVTLALNSASASVLQSEDGRISINFPQGAVFSQVEISLKAIPTEQLTSPPTGYDLATTAFRVDGLPGLLAKEATITVKYTETDLDRAEGDASRLRLARWDEAVSQWTVFQTKLDRETMILSTTTNQFSTWAVMAAPPEKMNWTLIGGGIAAGVIVVALLVYFMAVRKRV